jgi:hypothetical protein
MTRRGLLSIAVAFPAAGASKPGPLIVPVRHVLDRKAKLRPGELHGFRERIWPEAVRDFARSGIWLAAAVADGDVWRPPGREPVISGLERGILNLVITDQVPEEWDRGRALAGVTLRYRGHHLCIVALRWAHGHRLPLVGVNTCVHEVLHALLHDVFEGRPAGFRGEAREFRIDMYATRLWLFHDGSAIRESAERYIERLRLDKAAATSVPAR